MNERIKTLERQCWNNQTNHVDTEKFARLIVAECIDAASEAQADYYIIENIKSRLGAE
jgi:hypothetical protein